MMLKPLTSFLIMFARIPCALAAFDEPRLWRGTWMKSRYSWLSAEPMPLITNLPRPVCVPTRTGRYPEACRRVRSISLILLILISPVQSFSQPVIPSSEGIENKPVTLSSVEASGSTLFTPEQIISLLKLPVPGTYGKEQILSALKRIEAAYVLKGYRALAAYEVTASILQIFVTEATIEKIIVEGLKLVDEEKVKFHLISREGTLLDMSKLSDDIKRIMELGFFSDVKFELRDGSLPGKVNVAIMLSEKWSKNITGVEVKGLQNIPQDVILGLVNVRIGGELSRELLEKDMESISATGFFTDAGFDFESYNGGTRVVYSVLENPVAYRVTFKNAKEGNLLFSQEELLSVIKTKPGQVLNFRTLNEDRKRLQEFYFGKGYLLASDYDNRVEILSAGSRELAITLGEAWVEGIEIYGEKEEEVISEEGLTEKVPVPAKLKTKEYVIRRELYIKPGDILDRKKLNRDLQRIYNLKYFEYPTPYPEFKPGAQPEGVIVVVHIREGPPTGQALFGAGYSSQGKVSGSVSVAKDNLWGKGRYAKVEAQFGFIDSYSVSYREPWLDKKHTSLDLSLFNTVIRRDQTTGLSGLISYDEKQTGGSILLGRPFRQNEDVRVFLGLEIKTVDFDVRSGTLSSFFQQGDSRSLTLGIVKDTRNDVRDAKSGLRDSFITKFSGSILGGDFNFSRHELEGRRYTKVGKWGENSLTYATRGLLGFYEGDQVINELFFLGGADNLRGYDTDFFIGTRLLVLNSELRFPLSGGLKGVVFYDTGNTWIQGDFGKMKTSFGMGIRYLIPGLGPIRLDYGYGFQIQESQLHFSFGEMF